MATELTVSHYQVIRTCSPEEHVPTTTTQLAEVNWSRAQGRARELQGSCLTAIVPGSSPWEQAVTCVQVNKTSKRQQQKSEPNYRPLL